MTSRRGERHVIGLISDTHGLLRPGVHQALAGVELILHAGDVGGDDVLDELDRLQDADDVVDAQHAPGAARLEQALQLFVGNIAPGRSRGRP